MFFANLLKRGLFMKPAIVRKLTFIIVLAITLILGIGACNDQPAETTIAENTTSGAKPPPQTNGSTAETDSDGDGIMDKSDNCVNIPNESQEDYNSNGYGDACEIENFSEEEVCTKHLHWWKIDNYKKWRENPAIYPSVSCTKYVDVSKTTSTEDGSESNPFKTIQSAVNTSTAGDVICIKAGTYNEHYFDQSPKDCDTDFCQQDDFVGLFINKIGTPQKPIVIAAIEDGVVLEGSKKFDIGIYVSTSKDDNSIIPFSERPKFVEIYGITIQNYKVEGLYQRGSCIRFSNNTIRYNAKVIPDIDANSFWQDIGDYEFDKENQYIVFAGSTPKKFSCPAGISRSRALLCDNIDNDKDGLVDEVDEMHEKANVGRDSIYESIGSRGNIYTSNSIYENGWYHKIDCTQTNDNCTIKFNATDSFCTNIRIAYASPDILSCNEAKKIFTDIQQIPPQITAVKSYKYVCVGEKAYISFPNKHVADKIMAISSSDPNYPLKKKILENAVAHMPASGHGFYLHGRAHLIKGNDIHDVSGTGLSIRDPAINSTFDGNKIYRVGDMGIYYISTGRDPETNTYISGKNYITNNTIYENGTCAFSNIRHGLFIGPDALYVNPRNTVIEGNYIHDNIGDEIFIQDIFQNPKDSARTTYKYTNLNCTDEEFNRYGSCCPSVSINNNTFEGKIPIGPVGGYCTLDPTVKKLENTYLRNLKKNNTIIER